MDGGVAVGFSTHPTKTQSLNPLKNEDQQAARNGAHLASA
jgi:hypothetical protein